MYNLKKVNMAKKVSYYYIYSRCFKNTILFYFCCIFVQNIPISDSQNFKGNNRLKGGPTKARVSTKSQWIQESLDAHNFFRSLHETPPLVLNNTLSEISQYYADYLLQDNLKNLDTQGSGRIYFEHNSEANRAKIGENLYYSLSSIAANKDEPIPSALAVSLWYEEIKDYDFKTTKRKITSDPKAKIGHLTQVLWKNTTQMGTAYASSVLPNNQVLVFVVANYWPGGNWNKEEYYFENVLPPTRPEADINAAIVSRNVKSWWKEPEPPLSTPASWRKVALGAHNRYRSVHGAQPLRLNDDLCKVSQLWANHLLERGLQSFNLNGVFHQLETNLVGLRLFHWGETLMQFVAGDDLSADLVVKLWYSQRDGYDFRGGKTSSSKIKKTDAFERIVWNSTTEFCLSYARKKAENGQYLTYVTAYYYPSITNPMNDKKRNIFPSTGDPEEVPISSEDSEELLSSGDTKTFIHSPLHHSLLVIIFTWFSYFYCFLSI